MQFGRLPVRQAVGAVAVHAIRVDGISLKKGTLVSEDDAARLEAAGIREIVAARLESGDVGEDAAALRLAEAVAGAGVRVEAPFTGRSNLFAEHTGVLVVDHAAVDALNAVDEAVTFATLPAFKPVEVGEMIGTVKIIPFAVPGATLDRAAAAAPAGIIRVAPYVAKTVGVVSTLLPGLQPKVVDKTLRVLAERLGPSGARIVDERRVPHGEAELAEALDALAADPPDVTIVFGASAVADRRDVVPAAIEAAGGTVDHLGMPVDPGNLLLIGRIAGRPVIGAPGCARSPKENGFDWILHRVLAGIPVSRGDIAGLGVGGLLMEIVSRPQPREGHPAPGAARAPRIAAAVLAAGRSSRMGGLNKLLEDLDGRPLVRHAVDAALASAADEVVVVTGHQAGAVEKALAGAKVRIAVNPQFADGLATSLRTALGAVDDDVDGLLVLLGDMPRIDRGVIDRLIAAFDPKAGAEIVVPVVHGKRGNPVLWGRRFFGDLKQVHGDVGGRHLIGEHAASVVEVAFDDTAALADVDTPEMLAAVRAELAAKSG